MTYLKNENETLTDITINNYVDYELKKYGDSYVLYVKLKQEKANKKTAHIYTSILYRYIHWNAVELLVWNENIIIDDLIYDDWTRELKIWFHNYK